MTTDHRRILTTHVGSLPRPPALLALMRLRADGEAVDPEIAWAKLASLVEGARLASERLWA